MINDYYIIKLGKPYIRSYSSNKRTKKSELNHANDDLSQEMIDGNTSKLNKSNHSTTSFTNKK